MLLNNPGYIIGYKFKSFVIGGDTVLTSGEYSGAEGKLGLICYHTREESELILVLNGNVWSSFKVDHQGEFSYGNKKAKEIWNLIKKGIKGCTAKNGAAAPFQLGTISRHIFTKTKIDFLIDKYNNELSGAEISGEGLYLHLAYTDNLAIRPQNIPYIKLTIAQEFGEGVSEEEAIQVRTLEEISLEKDITWLNGKKYYVVNDDEVAEKLFAYYDEYKGPIAYDTETTGLRMNMFSKINSQRQRELNEYNAAREEKDRIRSDRLVGIILCSELNVSYYFPCFNRKFKNLYEDKTSNRRRITIQNIKARYTVGELARANTDMARYFRETPDDEISSDCIMMERCRKILENGHLVAHNGAFEWRVSWCYDIAINLKDDTMILHQLMYKFRSTTTNRGESSSLKYLTKREFGIDQLDLGDFFVDFKEDNSGEVRAGGKKKGKKKSSKIDFSYMDYNGTVAYAPADGDTTLALYFKYKRDMIENHAEMDYIYSTEIVVAMAIGYMEFYGHRLDEDKINRVRDSNKLRMIEIEHEIRILAKASDAVEESAFKDLDAIKAEIKTLDSMIDQMKAQLPEGETSDVLESTKEERQQLFIRRDEQMQACKDAIASSNDEISLTSPAKVAKLFFERMEIPFSGEKMSVAKKEIKPLLKMKDEEGSDKYPIVHLYSEWKKLDTLLTKFFDNLQYFMYPGGFIFSSYGQISTATGRMSCSKPNAQQYPKDVTGIVVPRDNYVMLDADFSQIEYRTLVAMAKEPYLAELFEDPDNDYHTLMASLMYGVPYASVTPKMRGDAKSFNFGIPYGMGFKSLAILLTGMSGPSQVEEAKEKYELYFKDQPNVRKFFDQVKEMALVNKYTKTYWNRYRYYSFVDKDGNQSNSRKAMALRQAGNAVIQGCLSGDTRIQTKDFGIVKIENIVGRSLQVWDGDKWSHGDITYSGKKQKCIVKFSTGQEFVCSPIHKFLVKSAKGNERFVECKDLRGSDVSGNPHRVVINRGYEKSDFKYSSDWAYKYSSVSNNAHNVFVDSMQNSFEAGVVLGRLASDGSIINREIGGSCILQYIAEHEIEIAPKLMKYMESLGGSYADNDVREARNEKVNRIYAYSASLVKEIEELDIKHQIHENIFMDTELLRGFLRGFFDGDGGISGKTITLTFGAQANFEPMCRDIQKALLFFGIRSRYRKYDYRNVISIKTNDNQKFLDTIGFVNEEKQKAGRELECIRDEHIFGKTLVVESVEITDKYMDMYDVCNTDGGYYVADGIITHNTAADIFKISVARNFLFIKNNGLLGQILIVNMVHDEQLMEINCDTINTQCAMRHIIDRMEIDVDGFPPLYVGAGFGANWKDAKGKMAEIHPYLAAQLSKETKGMGVWSDCKASRKEVLEYYNNRVNDFRFNKVRDYVLDSSNFGKDIHPAIGNLINLQFTYGLEKTLEGDELTLASLAKFIEVNGLNVDPNNFKQITEQQKEVDEDTEYEDEDEEGLDELGEGEFYDNDFALIDEDDKFYGISLQDLIQEFGLLVSKERKVCGIDITVLPYRVKDTLTDYLLAHRVEEITEGAMQVVFLQESKVLFYTGVWVSDIDGSAISANLRLNTLVY